MAAEADAAARSFRLVTLGATATTHSLVAAAYNSDSDSESNSSSSNGDGRGARSSSAGGRLCLRVSELADADYGAFTWPCATVLAQYLHAHLARRFPGAAVLELGAGTGLPGLVAACCGTGSVLLTDRAGAAAVLANLQRTVEANRDCFRPAVPVSVCGLSWGRFGPQLLGLPAPGLILLADCFYDPKEFEGILATVHYLLAKGQGGVALCAYQDRSADWCLEYLLLKYNMEACFIDTATLDEDCPVAGGQEGDSRLGMVQLLELRLRAPSTPTP